MTHPVPDAALEADIATVAQKGAGKSYTNRGLVERLLDKGRRVIVLDPLNSWWGLKAKADGSAGYPIAVIGGPNADIPLDPTKGEQIARILAQSDISVVLDVSDLTRSQLIAFATEFLGELYRVNRDPLWLVLEEADVFAPQSPAADGTRAMHDVVDQIARRGRARGFRLWSITQRPARLSKDVLTQTSTLLLLRIRSPQDRKAAEDWIRGHAEAGRASEIINSLASLQVGEGYVWAPDLDLLERVRFPTNRTLDTSATPKAGERRAAIKELAKPDLTALIAALSTAAQGEDAPATGAKTLVEAEKRGFDIGWSQGLEEGERRGLAKGVAIGLTCAQNALNALRVPEILGASPAENIDLVEVADEAAKPAPVARPMRAATTKTPNASGALGLVQTAASVHPVRLTWGQIAALAGRKPRGGHFNSSRKAAIDGGLLQEDAGLVAVTPAGLEAADVEPHTGPMADVWAKALPGPADKMFTCIREHPGITITGLSSVLQMQPRGGHWNSGMATLKRNDLIVETDGGLSLNPSLDGRAS